MNVTTNNFTNITKNTTDKSDQSTLTIIIVFGVVGLVLITILIIIAFKLKLKKLKQRSIYTVGKGTIKEKDVQNLTKIKTIRLKSVETTKIRGKGKIYKNDKNNQNQNVIITPREILPKINSPSRVNFREKLNHFIYQIHSPEKKNITDSNLFDINSTVVPKIMSHTIRASFINVNNIINVKNFKDEQDQISNSDQNLHNMENLINSRAELILPDRNVLILSSNVYNISSQKEVDMNRMSLYKE